jgi:hypothetical protein
LAFYDSARACFLNQAARNRSRPQFV